MQKTKDVDSTDILARKVGEFERYELTDCKLANADVITSSSEDSLDDATDVEYMLLNFESVDGREVVSRPMSQFILYNGQEQIISSILRNEYAYLQTEDKRLNMTDTEERAKLISEGELEPVPYPAGLRYTTSKILASVRQRVEMMFGNRQYPTYDRDSKHVANCSKLDVLSGIGDTELLEDYVELILEVSDGVTTGIVKDVINPSHLKIRIGSVVYDVKFDYPPFSPNHIPTQIAREMDAMIPENLDGRKLLVASGRYHHKRTKYNFIGRNRSKVLTFGVPTVE